MRCPVALIPDMVGLVGLEPICPSLMRRTHLPVMLEAHVGTGTGIRTQTVEILSLLPLPVGLYPHCLVAEG
jgi:hypothetical protein